MTQVAGPTAALAGIPAGLQSQGVWLGRRQLFVRFAAEAETATMYTADALAHEIKRSTSRSAFHSISVSGRDPLSNIEYLCACFDKKPTTLPVMLDIDGQRPEDLAKLEHLVTLVQVTLEGAGWDAMTERAIRSLSAAAAAGMQRALVLAPNEHASDAQLLRVVEQAEGADGGGDVQIVIHPPSTVPVEKDRRWISVMERAVGVHRDTRLALRLPAPTGIR